MDVKNEQELDLRPTSAEELKLRGSFLFRVSSTLVVRIRKPDMMRLLLEGTFPMPLLQAADRFKDGQAEMASGAVSPTDMLNRLSKDERSQFFEFLQQYCCMAIIDPIFTLDKADKDPTHVFVGTLETFEMMRIFDAQPPSASPAVRLNRGEADTFRRPEPHADETPGPDGAPVRKTPQFVDLGDREAVFG